MIQGNEPMLNSINL